MIKRHSLNIAIVAAIMMTPVATSAAPAEQESPGTAFEGAPATGIMPSTGVISGRVVWCTPLGTPMPAGTGAPGGVGPGLAAPGAARDDGTVGPPPTPIPGIPAEVIIDPSLLDGAFDLSGAPGRGQPTRPGPTPISSFVPAGAVLVAVQGTALNTRTDETGRFRIPSVPTGLYFTVAAGPVRGIPSAMAVRPNVLVPTTGQPVDLGNLSLGQQCRPQPRPLAAPSGGAAEPQTQRLDPAGDEPR